jgi:hypothetical protein
VRKKTLHPALPRYVIWMSVRAGLFALANKRERSQGRRSLHAQPQVIGGPSCSLRRCQFPCRHLLDRGDQCSGLPTKLLVQLFAIAIPEDQRQQAKPRDSRRNERKVFLHGRSKQRRAQEDRDRLSELVRKIEEPLPSAVVTQLHPRLVHHSTSLGPNRIALSFHEAIVAPRASQRLLGFGRRWRGRREIDGVVATPDVIVRLRRLLN